MDTTDLACAGQANSTPASPDVEVDVVGSMTQADLPR
jgi:hypothetical protein